MREHDARPELLPMLDLAHSVFNAVTGVDGAAERAEIRAFRPVLEWRAILEAHGFLDTMLYEVEPGDCTEDEMLCFIRLADDDAALPDATATTLPPLPMRVATEARRVPTSTPLVRAGLTPLRKALYNAPAALLEALKAAAHC